MMSEFLAHFLTYLPTPVRFCPNIDFQFYYMVSNFGKSTYLSKNRTSFMDVPLQNILANSLQNSMPTNTLFAVYYHKKGVDGVGIIRKCVLASLAEIIILCLLTCAYSF